MVNKRIDLSERANRIRTSRFFKDGGVMVRVLTVCSTIRGISGEGNVCKRGRFTWKPREVWKLSANWTELNSEKQTSGQFPLPVSALLPHSPSFTFNCSFPPRGGRCAYANIEENFIPYAGWVQVARIKVMLTDRHLHRAEFTCSS